MASEEHFDPLMVLHGSLLDLHLTRHFKKHLVPTKQGRVVLEDRFQSFHTVTGHFLSDCHRFLFARQRIMGNWDIWLNVIDEEAEAGVTGQYLTHVLYGPPDEPTEFDMRTHSLYDGVLKPLVWSGLLSEDFSAGRKISGRVYCKTQLWDRYLELDEKGSKLRVVH